MLAKMFRMMKRGNKGFTLVELMVVVVIIGVLTAIAVPVYNNSSKRATANAIKANVRIIEGAIAAYRTDNPGNEDVTGDDLKNALKEGGYLKEWPEGPKYNGADVIYTIGGNDAVTSNPTSEAVLPEATPAPTSGA